VLVQDAVSYQRLLDSMDYVDAVKGIRRGIDDVREGRSKPVTKAFSEIRRKNLSRRKSRRLNIKSK
jgi:hypothetical protein